PPPPPPPPPRYSPPPPPPPPRYSPPPPPLPINGQCASVHNSCASGASGGAREDAGFWYWGCAGANGGSAASCSEKKPDPSINGQCAAPHYSCLAGTSSNSSENNSQWLWKCAGLKGGTTVSCSENKPYLSLGVAGTGNGTIDGAKIGTTYYPSGTSITLTAEPNDDSAFTGWTGCDSASDFTCVVSLNKAKEVKALFAVASSISPEKKLYEGTDVKNFDEIWGWGGIFEGQTATLRSYWGGGDSSYNTFSSGNIAVDFDNFLDSAVAGNPMIYLEDISGKIGCSNANSSAQIKIAIGADGLDETEIRFRKNSVSDYVKQTKLNLDSLYVGEHAKNISFDKSYKYQLNPADLTGFYTDKNGGKILKSNPYIVVYFRTAGYPGSWSDSKKFYRGFFSETDSREKLGSSVKHKYGSESKALEKSGVVRVKIPLRLPDPKVDLKGASVGGSYGDGPVAANYGCPLNLQWENSGVNTCAASNTVSNDGWSGLLVKDMDLKLKSGTKMLSDIQKSGDYSLTCSRYLGSSLGTTEKRDTVAITASQKPSVTLQARNLTTPGVYTDGTFPINKGEKIELKWSASNASACKLYRLVGSKRNSGTNKETSGTLTINGLSESAVYEMECFNTYVQDDSTRVCSTSKTQDTMIISVLGEEPPPPTNLTATSNCTDKKMEVSWNDTADTLSNTSTIKENYYIFQKGSEASATLYTNSYADADATSGKSYTYSVKACNANGCSVAASVSTAYSCEPIASEHSLTIDILDGEDFTGTANDWKVDGTGKITVSSGKTGTDETGDSTISSGSGTSFTCKKSDVSTVVSCSYKFPENSVITLGYETTSGSFIEWGTGCSDSGDNCGQHSTASSISLTMDGDKNITAKFNDKYNDPYYLDINVIGVGNVSVISYDSANSATNGIKIDEDGEEITGTEANKFTCAVAADVTTDYPTSLCSYQYKYGDIIYISPSAGSDYSFPNGDYDGNYWNYSDDSSGCVEENVSYSYGKGTCKLTMDSDLIDDGGNTRTADIYFSKITSETAEPPTTVENNLTVNILDLYDSNSDTDKFIDGTGKVTVISNGSGTDNAGNIGTIFTCEKTGDYSSSCSYSFPEGSEITLKQKATKGDFISWATCVSSISDCNTDTATGSGDKTVILGTDKYITATFNDKSNDYYTLTVDILDATDITGTVNDKYVDGTGSVAISSDKTGTDETGDSAISSGSDTSFTCKKSEIWTTVSCFYKFPYGSAVTLNQSPSGAASFIEWGTDCDGYGDNCAGKSLANSASLTMDGDKNITAKFNDTTNDDEIVEETPSQSVELSAIRRAVDFDCQYCPNGLKRRGGGIQSGRND
ncbi:MAG: Peptidase S8/S53 subtilisin kexin sedolisin, partial [Parcubacteria group bacterium GW2011_GWB1_43_8]